MVSLQSGSQKALELDNIFHDVSRDNNLFTLKHIKQNNNNFKRFEFAVIISRMIFIIFLGSFVIFNGYSSYAFCLFNLFVHLTSSLVIYSVYIKQGFLIENLEKYLNNQHQETVDNIVLYESSMNKISKIKNYLMSFLIISLFTFDLFTIGDFLPTWFNSISIVIVFAEYFVSVLIDDYDMEPNINQKIFNLGIYKHNVRHTINLGKILLIIAGTAFISWILSIMIFNLSIIDYIVIFGILLTIALIYYIYKIIYTNYNQVENQFNNMIESII
jgi:hypothetical protein